MRKIYTKNTKSRETFVRGGGASSRVLWPEYVHLTHRYVMYGETADTPSIPPIGGVIASVESGLQKHGGNPFAQAHSYDPSGDLELSRSQYDRLQAALNQFEHRNQWAENNTAATGIVNASVLAEDRAADSVREFEHSELQSHAAQIGALNAADSAAGRVPSSAHAIGVAIQEKRFQGTVAKRRAGLTTKQLEKRSVAQTNVRNSLNSASVIELITLQHKAFDFCKLAWIRTKFYAMKLNRDIHNIGRRQHWDVWSYKTAQNMFAAPSGNTVTPGLVKAAPRTKARQTTGQKVVRWMEAAKQQQKQQEQEDKQREQERRESEQRSEERESEE